jgi:hypothetical protein
MPHGKLYPDPRDGIRAGSNRFRHAVAGDAPRPLMPVRLSPTLEGAAAYLFAGIHPERPPFRLGIAFDRALRWTGATRFCVANSEVKAATFCSASASVAVVPRICPISSFSAVLSILWPLASVPMVAAQIA